MIKQQHHVNFEQVTSMENIGCNLKACGEAMLNFNEHVILIKQNYLGKNVVAIYEFIETPFDDGLDLCECRINLVEISKEQFLDSGSAAAWALSRL